MRPEACPHCERRFADRNGLYLHIKAKHGRKLAASLRPAANREPSMADLVIEAQLARIMGEPVDEDIAEMFDV